MAIPNAPEDKYIPPPLPPPRIVPINGPTSASIEDWRPRPRELLEPVEELPNYKTRRDRDEGYHSMESRSRDSLGSARFGMYHDHYQFRQSANDYDHALVKKLDIRRGLDNRSPPRLRTALGVRSAPSHEPLRPPMMDRGPVLQPLSLPTRVKQEHPPQPPLPLSLLDSPGRYTETPLHSAVSPRSAPFGSSSHADDDEASFPMEETSRLRDFHLASAAGQKRRASSPPIADDLPPASMLYGGGAFSSALRGPRGTHSSSSTHDSLSSVSSVGLSVSRASSSYSCNLSPATTTATSAGGLSPIDTNAGGCGGGGSGCTSPYSPATMPLAVSLSPRSATSSRAPHHRTMSEQARALASPTRRQPPDVSKTPGLLKRTDFYMCDCCPKKPKKFDTEAQLRAHESEKQYECHYCGNRFKNKNEAERHQNSLHVRRHSWSCAALSSYDRAFHESTFRPGEADICGYCGEEFMRSGFSLGKATAAPGGVVVRTGDVRHATEQDWDDRIRHLQDVHKFRECNASKKFFRADHFRQHLKHSHAGTSGKWTNMLESACMLEEEPPLPMR